MGRRIRDSLVVLAMMITVSAGGVAQVPDSAPRVQVLLRRDIAAAIPQLQRTISLQLEGASLDEALRTVAHRAELPITYNDAILPRDRKVWLTATEIRTDEALEEILRDSGLQLLPLASGQVVVVKARVQGGTVSGRVTDAKTAKPIPNVAVFLDGTHWRSTTGEDGAYRLVDVAAGNYTLTASRIGYTKQNQSVTVGAGQEISMDFVLQAAATELEQVVVSGTVTPTERKAVPTPISVITADQIEQRGYQRVDQIFRGDVPGAIAWDQGPYNYGSQIYLRGASGFNGGSVKTYVDGVEMADPFYIATIDPASIKRIEVLRGSEGSTLYGSQALSGVIQIFTKRGTPNTPQPQVEAKASAGDAESRWDNTVQQDHSLAVTGGGSDFSYRLGGGFLHNGDWVAHAHSTNVNLSGSVRGTQGPVTMELSGLFASRSLGYPQNPDFYHFDPSLSPSYDRTDLFKQQMYGLTVDYDATPAWRHTLVLGYGRTGVEHYLNRPLYSTPSDTFLTVVEGDLTRASLAYHTTYEGSLGPVFHGSLTAGADHWTYNRSAFGAFRVTTTNNASFFPAGASRSEYKNSGYFAQGQIAFRDALFVTAGLRAEDNQNFGQDFGLAWAPRVGVAYVRTMGDLTTKARVAYGKAIRPPDPGLAEANVSSSFIQEANPNLAPEQQVGSDGGLDLYFGRRGSLEATYYHQSAIDLIDGVVLSAGPPVTYQNQNVGRIKNTGWEFQGRLNAGPLSLTGTYSIMNSIVETLSPTYTGDLRPGDQMLDIPKHTAGARLSYSGRGTSGTVGVTHIGEWTEIDYVALYGYFYGGQQYRGSGRAYWMTYPAFTKFNLSVSQTLTDRIGVFLRSDNVTNKNVPENNNAYFGTGRVTMIGVQVKS
jgi:outer membrane receptor protein involved in Fe transport